MIPLLFLQDSLEIVVNDLPVSINNFVDWMFWSESNTTSLYGQSNFCLWD